MVRRSSVIPWKASVQLTHIISDEEEKRWDDYVQARGCTVTDLSAWRHVVQDAYGIRSWFLAATRAGGIKGTLGLYEVSHPIFGHYLATAVFGNDGGLHFDDSEARDLLIESARKLADERDVDYLLIRTRGEPLDGFVLDDHYRTAMIDLSDGPEKVWSETLKAKTRNQIRRGIKERFTVSAGDSQLLPFFKVFHEHMRFLGSPAHSLRFYEAIRKRLTSVARFLVARDGRRVVGGALLFQVNGTAMNYHTVALNKYSRRCPNYLRSRSSGAYARTRYRQRCSRPKFPCC